MDHNKLVSPTAEMSVRPRTRSGPKWWDPDVPGQPGGEGLHWQGFFEQKEWREKIKSTLLSKFTFRFIISAFSSFRRIYTLAIKRSVQYQTPLNGRNGNES